MKKLAKVLSLSMVAAFAFSAVACGGGSGNTSSSVKVGNDGRRIVVFEYLNAGFGDAPYIALEEAFEAKNPDIDIQRFPNRELSGTLDKALSTSSGLSDIYSFMYSTSLKPWVTRGYVEDITDLCNQQTEDGRTMLASMTGSAADSIKLDNKIYAVPEYTNVTGIVYNQSLFEQYGWEIPETTRDFKTLCDKIIADTNGTVDPITWCADADGYLYFATENWITQYAGIANMDKFYEYASADVYATEDNNVGSLYSAKYAAFENLGEFFLPESPYVYDHSRTIEYFDAQYKIIKGECAMMLNGAWFENEMATYMNTEEHKNTKIGMFAVPEIVDDMGNPVHMPGYTTEDDKRVLSADYGAYYFIPSKGANKEDAKKFLLYLSSEEACEIYTKKANVVRPFIYNYGEGSEVYENVSNFGKSVLKMADEHYLYAAAPNHPFAWLGKGGLYARGDRPEKSFLSVGNDRNPDTTLGRDYSYAASSWDSWMSLMG